MADSNIFSFLGFKCLISKYLEIFLLFICIQFIDLRALHFPLILFQLHPTKFDICALIFIPLELLPNSLFDFFFGPSVA